MTKQQLRTQFLAKRLQLTDADYHALNQSLLQQFQQLDLTKIHCIHLFLPITERREPDTCLIRDWLKTNHSGIKIVYPQSNFKTLGMQSFADDKALIIALNSYGIPEPISGNRVGVKEIDLVILPLLAFDKQGYRVGYGKGFYDRFMAQCKTGAQFIGLSFFEPVERITDVNEFDARMHACLTPGQKWHWED